MLIFDMRVIVKTNLVVIKLTISKTVIRLKNGVSFPQTYLKYSLQN